MGYRAGVMRAGVRMRGARVRPVGASWLVVALLCGGCIGGPSVCQRDPISGSQRCRSGGGSPAGAVGTAAAAAVAWAVVGCTVNGCEPPFRCNGETKRCERIPCGEGTGACPSGYFCDPVDLVCR